MKKLTLTLFASLTISSGHVQAQAQTSENFASPRIVGGTVVTNSSAYPWATALLNSSVRNGFQAQFCGGALIKENWVLTAAHCLERGEKPADVDLLIGQLDLNGTGGERIRAKQIILHPDYQAKGYPDIALVQLSKASKQKPVEILSKGTSYDKAGQIATIVGWGNTSEGGSSSAKLRQVSVPIVTNQACATAYGNQFNQQAMVCAGLPKGGKDSCQGDSGGPMVVRDANDNLVHAGVVSFGDGCARPGKPGVYARVSQVNKWITEKIGKQPAPTPEPPQPGPTPTTGIQHSCKTLTCTFSATGFDNQQIEDFIWEFGDGDWDFGEKIKHRYTKADHYEVTLYTIDNRGDFKDYSKIIQVKKPTTPGNGSGLTFEGRLTEGKSSTIPKKGFRWNKNTIKATLIEANRKADFDLYLEHYDAAYGGWYEIDYSVTDGPKNEVISSKQLPQGRYRFVVDAYSGNSNFKIAVKP